MGLLLKLFGQELNIRFEGVTVDGKYFVGKARVKVFGADKDAIEGYLKKIFYVETGKNAKKIKIVAAV